MDSRSKVAGTGNFIMFQAKLHISLKSLTFKAIERILCDFITRRIKPYILAKIIAMAAPVNPNPVNELIPKINM
jgi:hypothetical protein